MDSYPSAVNTEIELITPSPTHDRTQQELISTPPSNPFAFAVGSPDRHVHINIPENLENEVSLVAGNQNGGTQRPSLAPSNPPAAGPRGFTQIWHVVMMVMIPASIEFAALKFENKNITAFQTHPVFANMAVGSFFVVIASSMRLFYIQHDLTKETMMLKALVCISWVLLAVSIAMVFIPPRFSWIGYLSIGVFLGALVSHYLKILFGETDEYTSEASDDDE